MPTLEGHNPDVLTCLANLSSDEVFTPPDLANQVLDLLPAELWRDPNARFLDPACKSGVFLREIARRLEEGLRDKIPDRQERVNHILKNQVFGIAITELTALLSRRSVYCSKTANGKYSVCTAFDDEDGNIRFRRVEHTWQNGRCRFCGASQASDTYTREGGMETHAYEFIHTDTPEEVFEMEFDVIVSNPPYQLNDGGGSGTSARPIYHQFVQQAVKLSPRFLSMIIPSRWFSGGKGLDEFRERMLADDRIRVLVDHPSSTGVFPGVDIAGGVCYFLWDRDQRGSCRIETHWGGEPDSAVRPLNEHRTLIRDNRALSIIRKVQSASENGGRTLADVISQRRPFGLSSTYEPKAEGVPCWFSQRIGKRFANPSDVTDDNGYLGKWKVLIPFAPIAGQTDFTKPVGFYHDGNTKIASPGECCTETYLVAGAFDTEHEALCFRSYLFTKVVRYLLLQAVTSQNVTRQYFYLIPALDRYHSEFTDQLLVERWGLSDAEWNVINERVSSTNEYE